MKARVVMLMAVGIAGTLLTPGCETSYRDPNTGREAKYSFETLRARLDLEIGTVYAAARRAMSELKLEAMRAAQDGLSGEIRAHNAHLDSVDVRVGAMPAGRTMLTIRIGLFGDRDKSFVLFERIMANLSEQERAAAAPSLQWGKAPIERL
jgi:hypothetical protein